MPGALRVWTLPPQEVGPLGCHHFTHVSWRSSFPAIGCAVDSNNPLGLSYLSVIAAESLRLAAVIDMSTFFLFKEEILLCRANTLLHYWLQCLQYLKCDMNVQAQTMYQVGSGMMSGDGDSPRGAVPHGASKLPLPSWLSCHLGLSLPMPAFCLVCVVCLL